MNPAISQVSEDGDLLGFTLSGINLCFANALRRTILSDIPCVVIHTETYETNQCNITKNTGRLHNEILKHRLSCIPIHTSDLSISQINIHWNSMSKMILRTLCMLLLSNLELRIRKTEII
jgi:DNA-directed RNA polymerase alpha subunit